VAEGAYALARHGDHTHLAYRLEPPDGRGAPPAGRPMRAGAAQQELNIEPEASYIISVKNPRVPTPTGVGRPRPAAPVNLPDELQDRFRGRRFIPVDPPDFLDQPGVEFILIAAARDAAEELGLDLDAYVERASHDTMLHDLRLDRRDRPVEPLLTGEWR
jgi:hypothetical protein